MKVKCPPSRINKNFHEKRYLNVSVITKEKFQSINFEAIAEFLIKFK